MAADKSEDHDATPAGEPGDSRGDRVPSREDGPRSAENGVGGMDTRMLELLVCPLTKKTLRYDEAANELVSEAAGLAYPVRGGVPILLPSEARPLRDEPVPGAGA